MDNDVSLNDEFVKLRDEVSGGFRKSRSNTKGLFMLSTAVIMVVIAALFHSLVRGDPYTGFMWLMWIGIVFLLFSVLYSRMVSRAATAEGEDVTLSMVLAEDETSRQGYNIAMALIVFGMLVNLFL